METMHMSWLARTLTVVGSPDPSLLGRSGVVVEESRNMLTIQNNAGQQRLAKNVIQFTIDGGEPIDGAQVCQRPEDRVQRKYRRN
jgi:RNase P/RNase MRP subunit p29